LLTTKMEEARLEDLVEEKMAELQRDAIRGKEDFNDIRIVFNKPFHSREAIITPKRSRYLIRYSYLNTLDEEIKTLRKCKYIRTALVYAYRYVLWMV